MNDNTRETIWGLPVVTVDSMPDDELLIVGDWAWREDADLIEEDGRWVVRLRGIGA